MTTLSTVIGAYREAWSHRRTFVSVYLALRLTTVAVLAPLIGVLVNQAVSLSSQTALTDQDIAGFLLSPVGFVASILVLSLVLLVEVFGFALMTAIWRSGGPDRMATVLVALRVLLRRWRSLIFFALLFVLRVFALVAPFAIAGLLVAWFFLTDYDINYYLSQRPPEAITAGLIIAVLVLTMALLMLERLTGWAVALHLVLFDTTSPIGSFRQSATLMTGKKFALQKQVVVWVLFRFLLLSILGIAAGIVLNLVPLSIETGLRLVLTVTLAIAALWTLLSLVVSALALGALTRIVDRFYTRDTQVAETSDSGMSRALLSLRWIGVGVVLLLCLGFWSAARVLDGISTQDNVVVIAHRGAAGSRPENTLASVKKAIEDRADWVEIDVQETADGEVVVVHDSDFMKLSGVDLKIWDATMEDLADIDIGGWFDPEYADQRTPLLREVLSVAKDRANVLIELKYYGHNDQLEQRVIRIVEELDMADQIATMSLKYPLVQEMLTLRPDWPAGVLAATAIGNLVGLDGDFVAVNSGQASPWLAQSLRAADKALYVWTVNDPLEMSKMMSMGVDGIITDEPALAREVIEMRAELSTPERLILWVSEELGMSLNTKGYRDGSP